MSIPFLMAMVQNFVASVAYRPTSYSNTAQALTSPANAYNAPTPDTNLDSSTAASYSGWNYGSETYSFSTAGTSTGTLKVSLDVTCSQATTVDPDYGDYVNTANSYAYLEYSTNGTTWLTNWDTVSSWSAPATGYTGTLTVTKSLSNQELSTLKVRINYQPGFEDMSGEGMYSATSTISVNVWDVMWLGSAVAGGGGSYYRPTGATYTGTTPTNPTYAYTPNTSSTVDTTTNTSLSTATSLTSTQIYTFAAGTVTGTLRVRFSTVTTNDVLSADELNEAISSVSARIELAGGTTFGTSFSNTCDWAYGATATGWTCTYALTNQNMANLKVKITANSQRLGTLDSLAVASVQCDVSDIVVS